jgi:hypothetical protein
MRLRYLRLSALILSLSVIAFSCEDEKETFESEPLSDYIPLEPGKYITYRLDSLVFPNFGRSEEIHRYQQKHVVDAMITDNLGRPSYRIYRYLNDSTASGPWVANGSYMITPVSDQVEVIENNLRFIKLHMPMKEGFSWRGNTFLPDDPYEYFNPQNSYDFGLDDWDYYYEPFEPSITHRGNTYTDVWTVPSSDEAFNIPVTNPTIAGIRTKAVDKYSKNIGLVYREYELWEWQPATGNPAGPYKLGFGVTMWMVDHN